MGGLDVSLTFLILHESSLEAAREVVVKLTLVDSSTPT